MIDLPQLAAQAQACGAGSLSIEDFEDWFAEASWNVHRLGDSKLTDAVFEVEALFSELSAGRLSADAVRECLSECSLRFRQKAASVDEIEFVPRISAASARPIYKEIDFPPSAVRRTVLVASVALALSMSVTDRQTSSGSGLSSEVVAVAQPV